MERNFDIFLEKTNIKIKGHTGTWYSIDKMEYNGDWIYLMESEVYGSDSPCIIIDKDNNLLLEDIWNGFNDWEEYLESMWEMDKKD